MSTKKNVERLRYRLSISSDSPLYDRLQGMSERDAKDWLMTAAQLLHHLSVNNAGLQPEKVLLSQAPILQTSKEMDRNPSRGIEVESAKPPVSEPASEPISTEQPAVITRRRLNLTGVIEQTKAAFKQDQP